MTSEAYFTGARFLGMLLRCLSLSGIRDSRKLIKIIIMLFAACPELACPELVEEVEAAPILP
jgi:hypothetical protein